MEHSLLFIFDLPDDLMEIAGNFLFYYSLLMITVYFMMVIRWSFAWQSYSLPKIVDDTSETSRITVIVAVRNEEQVILDCLKVLSAQNFSNMEIIISDDFSEDRTRSIVQEYLMNNAESKMKIRLIEARAGEGTGKKSALQRAINQASGDLILTTDADCTMSNEWVSTFAKCYHLTNASMITGFVRLNSGNSLMEKFQALEFLSLSGTGAASVMVHKPLLCNGANLCFSKSAFDSVGGYDYGGAFPSGDDTFLMLAMARTGKVVFNNLPESIVTSVPVHDMKHLIAQRKRWASKVQFYKEGYIKRTGILMVLVNFLLLLTIPSGFLNILSWQSVFLLWLLKASADLVFLLLITRFASQQKLLLLFLPAVLIYPLYSLAGIVGASGKVNYSWKGRNYSVSRENNE